MISHINIQVIVLLYDDTLQLVIYQSDTTYYYTCTSYAPVFSTYYKLLMNDKSYFCYYIYAFESTYISRVVLVIKSILSFSQIIPYNDVINLTIC